LIRTCTKSVCHEIQKENLFLHYIKVCTRGAIELRYDKARLGLGKNIRFRYVED
jgi:hypothetical protein